MRTWSSESMRTAIGILLLLGGSAAADEVVHNAAERSQDFREFRADWAAARDDRSDRLQIEILLDDFRAARDAEDPATLSSVIARGDIYLGCESAEAARETTRATREVRRDRREMRSDRMEVRESRREGAAPRERLDDRRDLRDDRRDLRDDRRDRARERAEAARLEGLRADWTSLAHDTSEKGLARREAILEQLAGMARGEAVDNSRERREDRRERREDRRERVEDRSEF